MDMTKVTEAMYVKPGSTVRFQWAGATVEMCVMSNNNADTDYDKRSFRASKNTRGIVLENNHRVEVLSEPVAEEPKKRGTLVNIGSFTYIGIWTGEGFTWVSNFGEGFTWEELIMKARNRSKSLEIRYPNYNTESDEVVE